MKLLTSKNAGRLGAALGLSTVLVVAAAIPAFAATAEATANALTLTLGGSPIVTTGTATATNSGSGETVSGPHGSFINVLNVENQLTAGVLAQNVQANNDGTSKACAGAVGAGGTIQVGTTQDCTYTLGTPAGIQIGGSGGIDANAVYAYCDTPASGVPEGGAQLVDATIGGNEIPLNPPPNTPAPGSGSPIVLNEQTNNPDGSKTFTAVDLTLPPGMPNSGAHLLIGTVTCYPFATTVPTSAFPVKGLPIAAGVAGLGLGAAYLRRRHNLARAAARA